MDKFGVVSARNVNFFDGDLAQKLRCSKDIVSLSQGLKGERNGFIVGVLGIIID